MIRLESKEINISSSDNFDNSKDDGKFTSALDVLSESKFSYVHGYLRFYRVASKLNYDLKLYNEVSIRFLKDFYGIDFYSAVYGALMYYVNFGHTEDVELFEYFAFINNNFVLLVREAKERNENLQIYALNKYDSGVEIKAL